MILGRRKYDSAMDCLKALHWLPVKYRINFNICTLVFKCLNKQAPGYLRSLLIESGQLRNLRSNSMHRKLVVPFVKKETLRQEHLTM